MRKIIDYQANYLCFGSNLISNSLFVVPIVIFMGIKHCRIMLSGAVLFRYEFEYES